MIYLALPVSLVETVRREFFLKSQRVTLEMQRYEAQFPDVSMQDKDYVHLLNSQLEDYTSVFGACSLALQNKVLTISERAEG